ncbi:MAG TPA: AAA family ATPase, partial [Methylocystis sp.]|nr:AAA family ATPase [Methylocystis sp.]
MRFVALRLERYGAFTDRVLNFRMDSRLHVVVGANETGKTTALNAIGDLLFGFPQRASFDFVHDKSNQRIGAELLFANGDTLKARRRRGVKNTLLDEDEKPIDESALAAALGAATRETFFDEFGLTTEKLRAGGQQLLQAGGRLSETLAAASSHVSELSKIKARLAEEAKELFGTRRDAGKRFYIALKRYQDAEKNLRDATVSASAFAAACAAVAEATERRRALEMRHEENGRELSRLQRAQRTYAKLKRLDRLQEEISASADLPQIDAATLASWRKASDELVEIDEALSAQEAAQIEEAAEIEGLDVDDALLGDASTIEALREEVGSVRKEQEQLPRRRQSLADATAELEDSARRLGFSGRTALLEALPTEAAMARVEELIETRRDAERRLAEAAAAEKAAARALENLDASAASRSAADPTQISQRLEAFADIPADAAALRRVQAAQTATRARLDEAAARLDPPAGGPDALARLPLPQLHAIEIARVEHDALDAERIALTAESRTARAALTQTEREIETLRSEGAVATLKDLAAARGERDNARKRLGAALEADVAARNASLAALDDAMQRV